MSDEARKAVEIIKHTLGSRRPQIGMVLGSGLGGLAEALEDPLAFAYQDLPGFVPPSVEGHAGRLVLGRLAGVDVACLQGRVHLYEGHPARKVVPMIRTLKLLGCDRLLVTNAAGALDATAVPGSLMLIDDHINLQGQHPLVGPNDEEFGPRFPALDIAYDPDLRAVFKRAAASLGIPLSEGVYLAVLGPTFETPAEVRAFARLGADAVGMSTVPEVIVARHCGMRVAGVSVLTNLAAGLSSEALSHEQTLHYSRQAATDLQRLVTEVVRIQGDAGRAAPPQP